MQKKAVVIPFLLTIFLTGCSRSGVDGSSDASIKASQDHALEKSLAVQHTKAARISIEMPALSIEINALRFLAAHPGKTNEVHLETASEILSIAKPVMGWPPQVGFSNAAAMDWGEKKATRIALANLLYTQMAGAFPPDGLSDPAAAQAQIISTFKEMPDATLLSARAQARREIASQLRSGFQANFSGSVDGGGNVQFYLGNITFTGGGAGWQYKQDGTVWFGDNGHLSGRVVMVGLDSVINKEASESKRLAAATSNEATQNSAAHVGAEAGGE